MAKRVGSHLAVYNSGGITLPDGAETGLFVDSSGALIVGGSFSIGAIVPGTGATNLGKAEDAPHASGDVGVEMLGVRNTAQATRTSDDGDYSPVSVDAAANVMVVGNVASSATDSGNGVKVAGKYNTSQPTLTDGQRGDAQIDSRGNWQISLMSNGTATAIVTSATNADGMAASATASRYETVDRLTLYNSSTFDRFYSNWATSVLASAARTATTNSADQTNYNGRGVTVFLNVTANPGGAETLSLKIQAKDPVSSAYIDVADAGVLFTAANGLKALTLYPGTLAADLVSGDVGKSGVLPRTWRAVVTHSSTGSWTYSVGSSVIL